jgi:hypothetical protein
MKTTLLLNDETAQAKLLLPNAALAVNAWICVLW